MSKPASIRCPKHPGIDREPVPQNGKLVYVCLACEQELAQKREKDAQAIRRAVKIR